MKKIKLLLVAILTISLFGCSSKEITNNNGEETTNEQTAEETVGDINDYLVEVELSDDNFNNYFEFVSGNSYDAFGEIETNSYHGLKSKKYDEGFVIYDMEDITIRFKGNDSSLDNDEYLSNLLSFFKVESGESVLDLNLSYSFIKMTPGTVRFIKSEYIESYEIDDYKEHEWNNATIT